MASPQDFAPISSVADDPVVKTIVEQYELLVQIYYSKSQSSSFVGLQDDTAKEVLSQVQQEKDFLPNLKILNASLATLIKNPKYCAALIARLTEFVEKCSILKETYGAKKKKKDSLTDEDAAYSLDCYVLKTMRTGFRAYLAEIFERYIAEGATGSSVTRVVVSDATLRVVYDRLQPEVPEPIRADAAALLGAFSSVHLTRVLPFFMEKFNIVGKKKEDGKNFAPYQRAMAELDFCVADAERTTCTVDYLYAVAAKIPLIKKGGSDIYPELFLTLRSVFTRVIKWENAETMRRWSVFLYRSPELANKFWYAYTSLYASLNKLLSKGKHRLHVVNTQQCMLSRATEEFYFSKNPSHVDNLMKELSSGVKDKKERLEFLGFIKSFVADIKSELVKKDLDRFSNFMKTIVVTVFAKANKLSPEECVVLEDYLVEYSQKHIHNCVKAIEEILEKPHTTEQRAVALLALYRIAEDQPDEIANYNYLIGPLVTHFILEEKLRSEVILLRAALLCFPRVKNPSEEQMKYIRHTVSQQLLHPDDEVVENAAMCLERSVEFEPNKTFVDILNSYSVVLLKVDQVTADAAIRLLYSVNTVLETYILNAANDSSKSTVDPYRYLNGRKRFEGVVLLWLCHVDDEVRKAAIRALKTISRDELRALSRSKIPQEPPYLVDLVNFPEYMHINHVVKPDEPPAPLWTPVLTDLLYHSNENEPIRFAWSELFKLWSWIVGQSGTSDGPVTAMSDEHLLLTGNYVKFLAMALRPSTGDSGYVFLLSALLELQGKTAPKHKQFHATILEALSYVDVSSIEPLLGQIRKNGVVRNQDKKTKNKIESADPMYEKNILELVGRILREKLFADFLFHAGAPIRDYYEDLIRNWVVKTQIHLKDVPGSLLSVETWPKAVEIVYLYMTYVNIAGCSRVMQFGEGIEFAASKISPLVNEISMEKCREALFTFVHPNYQIGCIDTVSVKAVAAISCFGHVANNSFIQEIVDYFHLIISAGEGIISEDTIVEAMSAFLANNPHVARTFIDYTFQENFSSMEERGAAMLEELNSDGSSASDKRKTVAATKTKSVAFKTRETEIREYHKFIVAIPKICSCYMRAIVKVLDTQLDSWLSQRYLQLGELVFLALVHQCAPTNRVLRDSAHALAYYIAVSQQNSINFGTTLSLCSFDDPCVYVRTASRYSEYASSLCKEITNDMFYEAIRCTEFLHDENREYVLRIIAPWASNYGKLLMAGIEQVDPGSSMSYSVRQDCLAMPLLYMIWTLTRRLHDLPNPIYREYLQRIWTHVAASWKDCQYVANEVVGFIIAYYVNCWTSPIGSSSEKIGQRDATPITVYSMHNLLRAVMSYVSRATEAFPAVVRCLVSYLREYREVNPVDKLEFAKWQLDRGVEEDAPSAPIGLGEKAAICLLADVTYEHDKDIVPYLPTVFLNAVVLFSAAQATPVPQATTVLDNLLQSLGLRLRKIDLAIGQISTLRAKYFNGKYPLSKPSRDEELLKSWTKHVSVHNSELAQHIATTALRWATQTINSKIALESLWVFLHLNSDYNFGLLDTISLCIFEAVRVRDVEKLSVLLYILAKTPAALMLAPRCLKLIFYCSFWMLFSFNKSIYSKGLQLMGQLHQVASEANVDPSVLNSCMYNVWKNFTNEQAVDVTVSKVIFKGLTDEYTFDSTLSLLEGLVLQFFAEYLPRNNVLLATTLIIHALLIASGNENYAVRLWNLLGQIEVNANEYDPFLHFRGVFARHITMSNQEVCHRAFDTDILGSFVREFAVVYQAVFGNTNGDGVAGLLCSFVRNGDKTWTAPSVYLLATMLPVLYYPYNWSPATSKEVARILRECMKGTSDSEEGEEENYRSVVIPALYFELYAVRPETDIAKVVFNFVQKPITGYSRALRARQYDDLDLFIGATVAEREQSRLHILQRLWSQTFSLSIDGNNANQVSDGESIGYFDLFLKMLNCGKDTVVLEEDAHLMPLAPVHKARGHGKSVFRSANPYAHAPTASGEYGTQQESIHTEDDESGTASHASTGATPREQPVKQADQASENPGAVSTESA